MVITVTGGTVTKGRNVTVKDKKKKTVASFDSKGKKSSSVSSSKKSPVSDAQSRALASGAGPLSADAAEREFGSASAPEAQQVPPSPPSQKPISSVEPSTPRERFASTTAGEFFTGVKQGLALTGDPSGRDFQSQPMATQAGTVAGLIFTMASLRSATGGINSVTGSTKVAESFRVGKVAKASASLGTAGQIATNTANVAKTSNWLGRLAATASNPQAIVGTLVAAIGSYPFAGFIKEEALQTTGFAVKSAIENGDLDNAQVAIDFQKELLDPSLWDKIKAGVPFANVLSSLDDFYSSARIKLAVDERVVSDLKAKVELGESDDQFYQRVRDTRKEEDKVNSATDSAYWAEVNRQKKLAAAEERAADLKYWDDLLKKREASAERERQANLDYWSEYYKTLARYREDSSPSNLKFGLL